MSSPDHVTRRRVLVVDDEPHIRRVLRGYLEADGFGVDEAGTAAQARRLAATADLVLLDIGLPDGNGLDLLRDLRSISPVYVILVTARAEEVDRLIGLEAGADDYVVKPFSPREVTARVRAVLRRAREVGPVGAAPLTVGGLAVDVGAREVSVDGAGVPLTPIEFDLLATMAAAPGQVFTRRQLLDAVWQDGHFGDERVVDVHVRGLRRALADDPATPRFVATVRGAGYKVLRPAGHGGAR
ncbi:response regulator transcription factor [Dietzia psychralcaliphila]|uniref:DNA-binding response regulator n=1 Tax=Dietzia psychralcaliphila TaxID=139021 RepID=A0AAD0NNQ8_9ACTN|nr:response regulator transcription factor [Dietzia psychralcaliphila]AWH97105.1 DNA-binding response regulator [Dietzia psychralcaliphila]PTM88053.1 DNA-binding response OmpR family regulator [Dietzia psychralcaliphila]